MSMTEGINIQFQNEHDEYTKLKERVDVAVELMRHDSFFNKESMLRVLGTEKAVKLADEIRRENEERMEKDAEKYCGAVEVDA